MLGMDASPKSTSPIRNTASSLSEEKRRTAVQQKTYGPAMTVAKAGSSKRLIRSAAVWPGPPAGSEKLILVMRPFQTLFSGGLSGDLDASPKSTSPIRNTASSLSEEK